MSPGVVMIATAQKRGLIDDEGHSPAKRLRVEPKSSVDLEYRSSATHQDASSEDSDEIESDHVFPTPSTSGSSTPKPYPSREKKFVCDFPNCGKRYNRPVRLAEHQRSHTNERPFVCAWEGCDKTFLRDSHLKHHVKAQHEDVRNFVCDWPGCGKGFATGQRMRGHRKRHEVHDQYRCTGYPPCDQYFRKPETLQVHILSVHLGEAPFICDHVAAGSEEPCGRRFKQEWNLKHHFQRNHMDFKYVCELCPPHSLEELEIAGSDMNAAKTQSAFATHGELQKHMKEVHPPICSECGDSFGTNGQLRAHIDIQHQSLEERRTVPCTEPGCDRMFTKKGNMLSHVRSAHKQTKFVCGEFDLSGPKALPEWDGSGACGFGFTTKANLISHVKTQHMNIPGRVFNGKKKRMERKARMAERQEDGMKIEPDLVGDAASALTGVGYNQVRRFPCAIGGCTQRFKRTCDVEMHLETVHGLRSIEAADLAETVREREALYGGVFWVGSEGYDEDEDEELASRLNEALAPDVDMGGHVS